MNIPGRTFLDNLKGIMESRPETLAVQDETSSCTYGQLKELSGKVCAYLLEKNIGKEDIILIRLPNSIAAIVSAVGILRAGGAFVFCQGEYTDEMALKLKAECESPLIIDGGVYKEMMERSASDYFAARGAHELAYITYTSGSTGMPKGVMIENGALDLCCLANSMEGHALAFPEDRMALIAPLGFTAGLIVMNIALTAGCAMFIPQSAVRDALKLKAYFIDNKITALFSTPSFYHMIADSKDSIRVVVFAGEPADYVSKEGVVFFNCYGQSETGTIVLRHLITEEDRDKALIPAGEAGMPGVVINLLDEDGEEVQQGEKGELCFKNPFFRGYKNLPEETSHAKRGGVYHSGDAAYLDKDGNYYISGRLDDMIKINGRRVEAAAITAALKDTADIDKAIVRKVTHGASTALCAYYTGENTIDSEEIFNKLSEKLPAYMVPSFYIKLDAFPLNKNGKIDYEKLPVPAIEQTGADSTLTDTERYITGSICAIMGLDAGRGIAKDKNLISIGMDSLSAIGLISDISDHYGVEINLGSFMKEPTIENLALLVDKAGDEKSEESAETDDGFYPLTGNQTGLYLAWLRDKSSTQYNMPCFYNFDRDRIDIDRLESCLAVLFDRYPVLKARLVPVPEEYRSRAKGSPALHRVSDGPIEVEHIYLDHEIASTPEEEYSYFQKMVVPYDLLKDNLYRGKLIVTPKKVYLFMDIHHIIFDGISQNIFLQELEELYNGKELGKAPRSFLEYTRIASRITGEEKYHESKKYFKKLTGSKRAFHLSTGKKNTQTRKREMGRIYCHVKRDEIAEYCRSLAVTESSYIHAAVLYTLKAMTREEEPGIVTIMHSRDFMGAGFNRAMGMFSQAVPLVLKNSGESETGEYIRSVHSQLVDSMEMSGHFYGEMDFVTDVMIAYQGDLFEVCIAGVKAVRLMPDTPQFPLTVFVYGLPGEYELEINYDPALFDKELIGSFASGVERVMRNMLRTPEIKRVSLLDEKEESAIIEASYGKEVDIGERMCWLYEFKEQVKAHPDDIAVCAKDGEYTYAQLDRASDILAAYLIDHGVKPGDFVAVKLDRLKLFMAAAAAIHKCRAGYVPVDMSYPQKRIDYILENSGAGVIFTKELIEEILAKGQWRSIPIENSPEDNAYMMYTSGSTGNPKGVVIGHEAMYNYLVYVIKEMPITAESRISSYASFSFDISVEGLYPALMVGGRVYIIPEEERLDLAKLKNYLRANRITGGCYPTQVGQLLGSGERLELDYICLIGEKMTSVPNIKGTVYNGYGPTETTVCCSYYAVDPDIIGDIPIGYPLYNTGMLILDPAGNIMPNGLAGEICVSGPQLAKEYYKSPEKTAEKFCPVPSHPDIRVYHTGDLGRYNYDGILEYLGRMDRQIKRKGIRIEPGEIESQALEIEGVSEAALVAYKEKLVLYLVAKEDGSVEEKLAELLPSALMPDRIIYLEEMPLTPNGKVDRKMLPMPDVETRAYTAPETSDEKLLCAAIAKILELERVGVDDDFFELGGNSLNILMLAADCADAGIEISDVLEGRTVRGMLAHKEGRVETYNFEIRSTYPIAAEHKKFFYNADGTLQSAVTSSMSNIPMLFRLPDDSEIDKFKIYLEKIVNAHPYLKSTFEIRSRGKAVESFDNIEKLEDTEVVARRDDGIEPDIKIIECDELEKDKLIRPFNLVDGSPLYHIEFYSLKNGEKYLFMDFDHLVYDMESFYVIMKQMLDISQGRDIEDETVTAYDVALEEASDRETKLESIKEYYKDLFKDCPKDVNRWACEDFLMFDSKSPAPDNGITSFTNPWDIYKVKEIRDRDFGIDMARVDAYCSKLGITPNLFFHGIFALMLCRCGGKNMAYYSTVYHNRDDSKLSGTVGMLCRTLPVFFNGAGFENASESPEAFWDKFKRMMLAGERNCCASVEEILAWENLAWPEVSMLYYDQVGRDIQVPGCTKQEIGFELTIDKLQLKLYRLDGNILKAHLDMYYRLGKENADRFMSEFEALANEFLKNI